MKLLNLITNLFKKKEILSEEEITLRELISKNIYITKEEKALKNLIVNNPEIAEKVYRTAKNKSYRTSFHFLLELAKILFNLFTFQILLVSFISIKTFTSSSNKNFLTK